MARIEDTDRDGRVDASDLPSTDATNVVDFDAPQDAKVSLPLDVLDQSHLVTLVQVLRRPPEMQLSPDNNEQAAGLEAVRALKLDPIIYQGSNELSYQIASLVVRREGEISDLDDPNVKLGFDKITQTLRMFEHLHIQSNQPGGA